MHNVAAADAAAHAQKYKSYEGSPRAVERVVHVAFMRPEYTRMIRGQVLKFLMRCPWLMARSVRVTSGVNRGKRIAVRPRFALCKRGIERKRACPYPRTANIREKITIRNIIIISRGIERYNFTRVKRLS